MVDLDGRARDAAAFITDGEGLLTHLAFVVTVPVTAHVLLRGQLRFLRDHGFEITVISSPGLDLDRVAEREGVRVVGIPIAREISPVRDARSLAALTGELRRLRPDLVNASTAKAGLLGMVAARAARIRHRIYTLRGLRLETEVGTKRLVLGATERIASASAHRVVCVSESLRECYVAAGHASAAKCVVLGAGASNGIEIERFAVTPSRRVEAAALRGELGLAGDDVVIGFVGRPVADKGIRELLTAYEAIATRRPMAKLVIVGAGFADDALDPEIVQRMQRHRGIHLIARTDEPEKYYAVMDVLAFPSHREGFPNAPIEAAASGVATVGFAATGVRDAVASGSTGQLVPLGDVAGFETALDRYVADSELRRARGEAARVRAISLFDRQIVWRNWLAFYQDVLSAPNSGI